MGIIFMNKTLNNSKIIFFLLFSFLSINLNALDCEGKSVCSSIPAESLTALGDSHNINTTTANIPAYGNDTCQLGKIFKPDGTTKMLDCVNDTLDPYYKAVCGIEENDNCVVNNDKTVITAKLRIRQDFLVSRGGYAETETIFKDSTKSIEIPFEVFIPSGQTENKCTIILVASKSGAHIKEAGGINCNIKDENNNIQTIADLTSLKTEAQTAIAQTSPFQILPTITNQNVYFWIHKTFSIGYLSNAPTVSAIQDKCVLELNSQTDCWNNGTGCEGGIKQLIADTGATSSSKDGSTGIKVDAFYSESGNSVADRWAQFRPAATDCKIISDNGNLEENVNCAPPSSSNQWTSIGKSKIKQISGAVASYWYVTRTMYTGEFSGETDSKVSFGHGTSYFTQSMWGKSATNVNTYGVLCMATSST